MWLAAPLEHTFVGPPLQFGRSSASYNLYIVFPSFCFVLLAPSMMEFYSILPFQFSLTVTADAFPPFFGLCFHFLFLPPLFYPLPWLFPCVLTLTYPSSYTTEFLMPCADVAHDSFFVFIVGLFRSFPSISRFFLSGA